MPMLLINKKYTDFPRLISAILSLALTVVLSQKPASATTYQYAFTFTAQDVLTALTASQGAALEGRLGVFSFFLVPCNAALLVSGETCGTGNILSSYTMQPGVITPSLIDPWTASTHAYNSVSDPSDLQMCGAGCASFFKVDQGTVQVITAIPAVFAGQSFTGTSPSPVYFGGVPETFNATAVPLTTKFTILLSAASINNPISFSGFASSATAQTTSSFAGGKADTGLYFTMNLTGVAPEPGTWVMFLGGAGLILAGSWKRRGARG
jgi:hypothetical protein